MYDPAALRAAFSGTVGILQSNLPQVPLIQAPLTTSSSGIYVQDKHPLVSLENIWYAAPDFNPNNYQAWVSGSNYPVIGTAVNDGVFGLYQSLHALAGDVVAPHSDAANWVAFNPFQSWLQQKFNQAVTNLFAEVVKQFKLQDKNKAIIERQQLFRGGGRLYDTIVPDGSFVGFEILPQQAEALLVQIDNLGVQFTSAQNLTFYLFHSGHPSAAIKTFVVAVSGSSDFSWQPLASCIMQYLQENTQGTYIFGYFEDDLNPGNQAVSKVWDCTTAPCASCDGADLLMYNRWSRWTAFRNVKIPPAGLNGVALPNFNLCQYQGNTNWGLNFSLTIRCDYTNFIIYSKLLYSDVFAMQLCLEFIKTIAHSSRINPTNGKIQEFARAELNLKESSTFINQYRNSIAALNVDMSGFSKSCQPCNEKGRGGKWTSN